jgi:hypothetical protein
MACAESQDVLHGFAQTIPMATSTADRVRWPTRCGFRQALSVVAGIYNRFSQLASLFIY